jgi:hypothetical protein
MKMRTFVLAGMLIGGAASLSSTIWAQPSFTDPGLEQGQIRWFLLSETKDNVRRQLGQPKDIATFPADFEAWQYEIGETREEESSHQLVFRKSTGQLISVTRNYEPERVVDEWFPPAETSVYLYPDKVHPRYGLRLRRLPGGRVLMAMGISAPGQKTGQIVLMRESEIRFFYPWLADQLH